MRSFLATVLSLFPQVLYFNKYPQTLSTERSTFLLRQWREEVQSASSGGQRGIPPNPANPHNQTRQSSVCVFMSELSLNRQENPDLSFKCTALLLGQLWQFLNTLSVLSGLKKKKKKLIISENVNVSTQERMVSYQPTRLIFPLCWVWFLNSFLGKSSAVIFLLPAKWITSLHPLSTSPSLLHFQKNTQGLVFGILNTSDRHFTRLEGLPMLCRRAQACELPAASEVY